MKNWDAALFSVFLLIGLVLFATERITLQGVIIFEIVMFTALIPLNPTQYR